MHTQRGKEKQDMDDERVEVVIHSSEEDVNRITRSIQKTLSISHPEPSRKQLETSRTIVRVPNPTLRQHGDFDPQFMSIGPLHRSRKPVSRLGVKRKYLQTLLGRDKANKLDKFVKQVSELEPEARRQYPAEISKLSKDEFVEMMVLDGCFVVEFLVRQWLSEAQEQVVTRGEHLLKKDLVRLENQIPFCVLDSIFKSCVFPPDLDGFSLRTIALAVLAPGGTVEQDQTVHHLLHLLHLSMDDFSPDFYPLSRILHLLVRWFYRISYGCVRCFVPDSRSNDYERAKRPGGIPNAAYLRDSGFKFVLNQGARSFLDIRIRGTTVQIPLLRVSAYNLSLLRNLLTFEKFCSLPRKHVTGYGTFMCNLVKTREDVEILQEGGIIGTFPGSVSLVLSFFESICRGERLDRGDHHLAGEVEKIDVYFNKNYHKVQLYRWRKRLIPDYFSNPWAVPSMVAAFILLLLTMVQTVFAVYSYYRPPS